MSRRRADAAVASLALALALLVAGCGDDGGTDAGSSSTTAPPTSPAPDGSTAAGPDPASLSSFATLDDLAGALTGAGQPCHLEYEGLEDDDSLLSICILDSGQATLRIWDDPGLVAELVATGTATDVTVYGANWTIDLRDAAVAATVAEALGGATGA